MPGYDGTGPLGRGSLTGRRLGYCAVPTVRATTPVPTPVPRYGLGLGYGRGFGRRRGRW